MQGEETLMDDLVNAAGQVLISQGPIGIMCLVLLYVLLMMRAELRDTRTAHRTELVEKDKLIYQLQEARLEEVRSVSEIAKSTQITLSALTTALQDRRRDSR